MVPLWDDIAAHHRSPLHSVCVCWGGGGTYPVQADDHLVVVVLVLLGGGLQGDVQVGPREARDEEVHHGPQLQEGVVQRRVDQEQALLAAHESRDHI